MSSTEPSATSDSAGRSRARRFLGLLAQVAGVVAVAALLVGAHYRARHPEGRGFGLAYLNWFDAYVYLAMTEQPAVFTVAPWGYRTLAPWLAHVCDATRPLRSLRIVTLLGLVSAATLLVFFLRRRGFGWRASLLGLAIFCFSPPVAELLENPFVVDGVGIALVLAFLLALECGAGVLPLLLLIALGLQTKELFLAFVPLLILPLRRCLSLSRAMIAASVVGIVFVTLGAALKVYWTPHIATPHPALDAHLVGILSWELRALMADPKPIIAVLLLGLTPLAAAGALRASSRPFLRRYGYLVGVTFALPFLAWLNVPDTRPFGFFGDVPRLHLYALPFFVPLALVALGRLFPSLEATPLGAARPIDERHRARIRVGSVLMGISLVAVLVAPFALADRYRRFPLHSRRDGLQILFACRYSLGVAGRLERGESVAYPVGAHPDLPADDPQRRRWFLVGAWSDGVYTGDDELRVVSQPVSILIPSLHSRALTVELRLTAAQSTPLDLELNGQPLATWLVSASDGLRRLEVPTALVWRGDNVLTFSLRGSGEILVRGLKISYSTSSLPSRT